MITTEHCCCCCKLETGGLIFGWIYCIFSTIMMIAILLAIIVFSLHDGEYFSHYFNEKGIPVDEKFVDILDTYKAVIIVVLIIAILIYAGFFAIGYLCIKGTLNRNHNHVKPMMILFGVTTVLVMLQTLSFSFQGLVAALVYGLIYGYFFVVVYSLYDKLRQENERCRNVQYRPPLDGKA